MLFSVLAVSVISIALAHSSLNPSTMDTKTATRYHPNEVANPNSALKESTGSTADTEIHFDFPERDDQIIDEQHEKAPRPDVADSAESLGQVSDVPTSENPPTPTPFPDGRIFMQGEPPYGYLPTCGPKDKDTPFIPVEPD